MKKLIFVIIIIIIALLLLLLSSLLVEFFGFGDGILHELQQTLTFDVTLSVVRRITCLGGNTASGLDGAPKIGKRLTDLLKNTINAFMNGVVIVIIIIQTNSAQKMTRALESVFDVGEG